MGFALRARTALAAALLPALATAGAALGSGPPPTRDAMGELPYAVYQGKRGPSTSVQIFVAPSGKRLRWAAVRYRATCGRSRVKRLQVDDLGGIVIERRRRFVRRERFRADGQTGRRVLSGRFDAGWRAATVRYETRYRDRDGARCAALLLFRLVRLDSTVPPALTTPAVPAPPAMPDPASAAVTPPVVPVPPPVVPVPPAPVAPPLETPPSSEPSPSPEPSESPELAGRYAGTTEAGEPIAFTLGEVGAPLTAIAIQATLTCTDGERVADLAVDEAERGRLRANGRFAASGRSGAVSYDVDGAVADGVASGRISIQIAAGDRCRSGQLSFSVQRT